LGASGLIGGERRATAVALSPPGGAGFADADVDAPAVVAFVAEVAIVDERNPNAHEMVDRGGREGRRERGGEREKARQARGAVAPLRVSREARDLCATKQLVHGSSSRA